MMVWIIIALIVLTIATVLDIKYKGLGYKMLPKSMQRWFHKK